MQSELGTEAPFLASVGYLITGRILPPVFGYLRETGETETETFPVILSRLLHMNGQNEN